MRRWTGQAPTPTLRAVLRSENAASVSGGCAARPASWRRDREDEAVSTESQETPPTGDLLLMLLLQDFVFSSVAAFKKINSKRQKCHIRIVCPWMMSPAFALTPSGPVFGDSREPPPSLSPSPAPQTGTHTRPGQRWRSAPRPLEDPPGPGCARRVAEAQMHFCRPGKASGVCVTAGPDRGVCSPPERPPGSPHF